MTNVRHVLCPDVPKSVGTSRGVLLRQWLLKISEEAVPPRPTPVTPLG